MMLQKEDSHMIMKTEIYTQAFVDAFPYQPTRWLVLSWRHLGIVRQYIARDVKR
jgi:hypothetical protein